MIVIETDLKGDLELVARGKVRDIYKVDDKHLLLVSTDRISAFDVVLNNGIPGKGTILTQLSVFWFEKIREWSADGSLPKINTHFVTADIDKMPEMVRKHREQLEGRSILVRRFNILPIEAIVRGYITGSGWKEYRERGSVCDLKLPAGLKECEKLPTGPLFTPSTKAEQGAHDENIHPSRVRELIGDSLAQQMEQMSVQLYKRASEFAAQKGIIIADTKFEFGTSSSDSPSGDQLFLVDEVLTPDSSRFWPAAKYEKGRGQESFDKQYIRDYLTSINFDKKTPIDLPQTVIDRTLAKYQEIFTILTCPN